MNETEQLVADVVYAAIQHASNESERSQQAKQYRVGMSDLGFCSERTRRMIAQQDPGDKDTLKAFIGTAIGDHVEKAVAGFPHMPEGWEPVIQAEVSIELEADDGRRFLLPGHPDIVFRHGLVIDAKTAGGLDLARRVGADQQKRFQRHLYGKAAFEAGLMDVDSLDDVMVGNLWVDRTGEDQSVHVEIESFSQDVIDAATHWLTEVIDAYISEREAIKEPPREMCAVVCGFFATCRMGDTDVEGLITDPTMVEAVRLYVEAGVTKKLADRQQKEAKAALKEVQGSTGQHILRWTHINETTVPGFTRKGYDKIDIKPVKGVDPTQ
jgi:hypothetical protein